ncbi:MAG: hypothetical protein AAF481_02425 [Acidobacteriota bacterium]
MKVRRFLTFAGAGLLALGAIVSAPLAAQSIDYGSESPIPSDEALEASEAVIGEIVVRTGNVFDTDDPAESKVLFRFANRVHRTTRPAVIEDLLLFRSGDLYSRRILDETERLLRSKRYLYDAQIRPIHYGGNRVDLEVVTRDVWTLTAGLGFSRSGGENSTRFEVQESNFLGTGREIIVERTEDVDRTRELVAFADRSLGGTHAQLELWLANMSDGSLQRLELERPFVSLDARWGSGLFVRVEDRVDPFYLAGREVDRFRHQRTYAEFYWGRSKGLRNGWTRRLLTGYTYDERQFGNRRVESFSRFQPRDRTLSYPWLGFEVIEDRFLETNDLDQLQRTEDFFIGRRFHGKLGYSPEALGGDQERWVFDSGFSSGHPIGDQRMLLLSGGLTSRWADGQEQNLMANLRARFYQRNFGNNLFFVSAEVDATQQADIETQLLLGGDSGLRGYPLRYQDGNRRFLVTLEQRFYTDWHLFQLVHVGGAVFFDIGRAWFDGEDPLLIRGPEYTDKVLKDIGFGLRLSSSRSGQGSMIHLDVAFPLDRDDSISGVQWLISTKETF